MLWLARRGPQNNGAFGDKRFIPVPGQICQSERRLLVRLTAAGKRLRSDHVSIIENESSVKPWTKKATHLHRWRVAAEGGMNSKIAGCPKLMSVGNQSSVAFSRRLRLKENVSQIVLGIDAVEWRFSDYAVE